jgi:sulfatase maturation enzyme AslB (radical SAM superfamily)
LYHIEGEHYEKKNNISRTPYTLEKFKKHFTDNQLDELIQYSGNLERIELYGGEPFLDSQIPKYLLQLVETGASKHIDLSVSTNATHKLNDAWRTILTNFNNVILNTSIDGIGDRFTYLRHPGDWDTVSKNLQEFFELEYSNTNITIQPVITVSALNVWYVQEVFDYFSKYNVTPFIILVQWPNYYCVNVFPDSVKTLIEQHLRSFNNPNYNAIINLMNTTPSKYSNTAKSSWDEFKFWTKEKDAYRNENFIQVFDEIGKLLIKHNQW